MTMGERFARLPTAVKLLLILTAVLLPIGIALAWIGETGIRQASAALDGRSKDQSRAAARAIESLIARNSLALRIAAAGGLQARGTDPCADAANALATAPAISRRFALRSVNGDLICTYGGFVPRDDQLLVAPGDIRVWIDQNGQEVDLRVGVNGGMATASVPREELLSAALEPGGDIRSLVLHDDSRQLWLIPPPTAEDAKLSVTEWPISNGSLRVQVGMPRQKITPLDQLMLLLPVLMWVAAALITWLLVSRLLVRPLKRLERAVRAYRPGQAPIDLPRKLGPSEEIQELRDAFARAVARVDDSEREMTSALEGQRRLVREVHHRVKNNLQVIASLLNIHGRGAEAPEARAAYAGISRRVGALSIVHRNNFAEIEENRGISLRPLIAELAAELRAGAPEPARGLIIDLELDTVYTTQDVAVAVAFLITEIVEFAMLSAPEDPVELSLRRTSELTARLSLSSQVLNPDDGDEPEKVQFERIVAGLAKQLRSDLERKLGRYSVDLPVFPSL
ncbi:MAG: two-component system, sensor histidine kinase PdtaS [Sphingomonadales bacterium]|jgi:two-component sensor histidine kinase|nr:two-component system, sensor histidine kinase PdtaS [Sphingomonadales bacterium]